MAKFDVAAARKAGFTDQQIAEYIKTNNLEPYDATTTVTPSNPINTAPVESTSPISDQLAQRGLLGKILSMVAKPGEAGLNYLAGSGVGIGAGLAGILGNKNAQKFALKGDIPFLTSKQEQDFRGVSSAPVVQEGVRQGAGIAPYVLPVGKGVQALETGAIRGGLSAASNEGASPADILMGGATGGLTEGIIANLLPFLSKSGRNLQKGVTKPGEAVKADPFYSTNVEKLMNTKAEQNLTGNAASQLEQLPKRFKALNMQAEGILQTLPDVPKAYPIKNLTAELDKVDYLGDTTAFKNAADTLTNRVAATEGNPVKLYNLKSDLGGEMNPIFKKLQVGNPLLPKEAAKLATYDSLKNTLDELSPEIRKINLIQKQLYDLSEGLVKNAENPRGLQIPIIGNVGGNAMQSAADFTGRTMSGIGNIPKSLGDILGASGAIASGQFQNQPTGSTVPSPISSSIDNNASSADTLVNKRLTPEMMLAARLSLNNKDYAKLKDIYDIQVASEKTGTGSEAQVARKSTTSLIKDAYEQLKNNPNIKTGMVAGPLESLKGQFNAGDQATLDLNTTISNLAATIAKARGGTSFTPNEQAMLERYSPKVGDSRQILLTKLEQLRKQFIE